MPLLLTHANYLLLCTAGTIALLMLLILRARLHPAIAILISAIVLGVVSGMPLSRIPASISTGVGSLLAHVALVLGLGAVLGHLLASSGGAAALGEGLVGRCGPRGLPIAMMLMGMLVGFPVFFEVGLVLLMPIVVSVARRSGRSPILAGMPTLAGLSIVHGLIPPHPAAMMAVAQYHADVGKTILLGLAAGLPAALLAGPAYAWVCTRFWDRLARASRSQTSPSAIELSKLSEQPESLADEFQSDSEAVPQAAAHNAKLFPAALFALLLPVLLIFLGSWADLVITPQGSYAWLNSALHLLGDPPAALLCAILVAQLTLGRICGWKAGHALKLAGESFGPIAGVLMILASAGGLSRVLADSGAAQATVELAQGVHLSPLLLGWLLAATVRVSIGSATVAMAVTTGILAPVAASMGAGLGGSAAFGPELLVLATGAGSLFCSHVNDPGFWMIKEFFGLEVGETLATWSVLETILSVVGLLGTLLLAAVLK
jgi:gluconate:H+ symporter, GntP family